jgi:adenylosuccinate lyase
MNPTTFIGRSPQQVDRFLKDYVEPVLKPYSETLKVAKEAILKV